MSIRVQTTPNRIRSVKLLYVLFSWFFLFGSECVQKFGAALGEEVWNVINAVFDALPLAAIVDDKVIAPFTLRSSSMVGNIDYFSQFFSQHSYKQTSPKSLYFDLELI